MTPKKEREEMRARCAAVDEDYDAEDRICAKCGERVYVKLEDSWDAGDWCHPCWQEFGEHARIDIPRLLDDVEELKGIIADLLRWDGGEGSECWAVEKYLAARDEARAVIKEM